MQPEGLMSGLGDLLAIPFDPMPPPVCTQIPLWEAKGKRILAEAASLFLQGKKAAR